MTARHRLLSACAAVLTLVCTAPAQVVFRVSLGQAVKQPVSGRLLVFATSKTNPATKVRITFENIATADTWVTGKEVSSLTPGESVDMHADELSYPTPLAKLPAGDYQIQALLDTNHHYVYDMSEIGGEITGPVVRAHLPSNEPVSLQLSEALPPPAPPQPKHAKLVDFESKLLAADWGRPMHIRGWLVLPPGYDPGLARQYPTVYVTFGYGSTLERIASRADEYYARMESKAAPEMIYVLLDQSSPRGTHEFADSVNNGPWGDALTREVIPQIEKNYHMDSKFRFLTGHSSGGWASLWLQVAYPSVFAGTWPTAPDPPDFRNFTGVDLTKDTDFYRKPDGSPRMLVRMEGKDVLSLEQFARMERVMGDYGGQMASFEYVFSPRGEDGRPMQLFNRDSGAIDREVAAAWEKYDVSRILRDHWKDLGPRLDGKIHLTVGSADTFHLDESARLLEQTMKELGAKASFTFIPGRTHMNLYEGGLDESIAREMYAVARPKAKAAAK
jgi:Putative esterase